MSTRNLPGGKKRPARRADNLAAVSRMSENVGASTSRNPKGLHGLYRDNFTFTPITKTNRLMLFREIISVYSENYTAHINTLCGQNGKILMLRQVVHIVTAVL
jgi:hypothetical protein